MALPTMPDEPFVPVDTTVNPVDTMIVDTTTMLDPCDPDVVYFERDILPTDPRRQEAQDLVRLQGKMTKALGVLRRQGGVDNVEAVDVRRASLRSGNR